MVLDKYFNITLDNGLAGQDGKTGIWYCKDLPFKDAPDLDKKIGEVNKVLNGYNKKIEIKKKAEKKEKIKP